MTQVETLAKYAARASFADLSAESRRQLPIHILDSLGCCIAALGAGPDRGLSRAGCGVRRHRPVRADRRRKVEPDLRSVLAHRARTLRRFHGQLPCAQTETCHTADNFGVALTIADYVGASGRDLMLAVALAYTVQSRFVDHANFMTRGFDHTAQLAFSLNAASGRLLGLASNRLATRSRWPRSATRPSRSFGRSRYRSGRGSRRRSPRSVP